MASDPDPVQVAVELLDSFSEELEKIERKLNDIDGETLQVLLDINDSEVSATKAKLELLEEQLEAILDIDVRGYGEAVSLKELLERDMESTLHINAEEDGDFTLPDRDGPSWKGVDPPGESLSSERIRPHIPRSVEVNPNKWLPDFDEETVPRPDIDATIEAEGSDGGSKGTESTDTSIFREIRKALASNPVLPGQRVGVTPGESISVSRSSIPESIRLESEFEGDYRREVDRLVHQDISQQIGDAEKGRGVAPSWSGGFETKQFAKLEPDVDEAGADFLENIRRGQVEIEQPDIRFGDNLFGDLEAQALRLGEKWDFDTRPMKQPRFPYNVEESDTRERFPYDIHDRINVEPPDMGGLFEDMDAPTENWDFFSRNERDDELSFRTKIEQKFRGFDREFGFDGSDSDGGDSDVDLDAPDTGNVRESLASIDNPFDGIGKTLRKNLPSMRMWWNLLGLLMPLMIAAGGAALGLAAALGAVGVAAMAIGGLGLLGLENADARIAKLKEDIQGALAPASSTFAPFVKEMLAWIPNLVGQLTDELQGLTAYQGFIKQVFSGGVDFISRIITAMTELSGKIQQISMRFGRAFGNAIIKLLKWAVNEVYNNQEAFAQLAKVFIHIGSVIYQMSKIIAFFVAALTKIAPVLSIIGKLLENEIVVGVLSAIAGFLVFYTAILKVTKALAVLSMLGKGGIFMGIINGAARAIGALYAYIQAIIGARAATVAFLTATGVGIALIAGGLIAGEVMKSMGPRTPPSSSSYGGFGGGMAGAGSPMGNTVVNNYTTIQGNVDDGVYEEMSFTNKFDREANIDRHTKPINPSYGK